MSQFGERTEEAIRKEVQEFEEWLRDELADGHYNHGFDNNYIPNDNAIVNAIMLDEDIHPFETEMEIRNREIEEMKKHIIIPTIQLAQDKKEKANEFFKELGVLDK